PGRRRPRRPAPPSRTAPPRPPPEPSTAVLRRRFDGGQGGRSVGAPCPATACGLNRPGNTPRSPAPSRGAGPPPAPVGAGGPVRPTALSAADRIRRGAADGVGRARLPRPIR